MPKILDRCVKHVIDQGKDKNSAYAICSKSTGWVKSGAHSWRKKRAIKKEKNIEENSFCSKRAIARLEQLLENDFLTRYRDGVFSSVDLDPTGLKKLQKYLKDIGIQMLPLNKAHITVIYSRTRPQEEPKSFKIDGYVTPKSFGFFGKGTAKEPYVLVLEVESPELKKAHLKMRKDYRLTPTYPEYKPHLTLTYDINRVLPGIKNLKPSQKQTIINIFNKMIPELPQKIKILNHKIEPINLNWV